MKAVVYEKYGSPEVFQLTEVEKPTPKDDEVLIDVHATATNAVDWRLLRADPSFVRLFAGLFKPKYRILGADIAGKVEAVGKNITQFKPGDAVFGSLSRRKRTSQNNKVIELPFLTELNPKKEAFLMVYLRRSNERGPSDLDWLQSRHSFSFGSYYDPDHMGVSVLRVINDDQVQSGKGFGTHSHQDMEIISYVKQGTIEHKDSMGNIEILPAGEFQLMSAGTGVTHSEYNPSDKEILSFLQIWIEPTERGVAPGYQQKHFGFQNGLKLVVSPDGRDGTLSIHQDAYLYQLLLDGGESVQHPLANGRTVYIHIVAGHLAVNDILLEAGDGIGLSDVERLQLNAPIATEALIFDLP